MKEEEQTFPRVNWLVEEETRKKSMNLRLLRPLSLFRDSRSQTDVINVSHSLGISILHDLMGWETGSALSDPSLIQESNSFNG